MFSSYVFITENRWIDILMIFQDRFHMTQGRSSRCPCCPSSWDTDFFCYSFILIYLIIYLFIAGGGGGGGGGERTEFHEI